MTDTKDNKQEVKSSSSLPTVNIKELFESYVHYGHSKRKLNPYMSPYLYGRKGDICLINLKETVPALEVVIRKIYNVSKKGGDILFVGTKPSASKIVQEEAENCKESYVTKRWLGGILTNHKTISKSLSRLYELEKSLDGNLNMLKKKEVTQLHKEKNKLINSLGGIRKMSPKPNLIVILDVRKEHLAIKEAKKLKIPVVAICDTNVNPSLIDYIIPGNDDSIESISLYMKLFSQAVNVGKSDREIKNTNNKSLSVRSSTKKFSQNNNRKFARNYSNKKENKDSTNK